MGATGATGATGARVAAVLGRFPSTPDQNAACIDARSCSGVVSAPVCGALYVAALVHATLERLTRKMIEHGRSLRCIGVTGLALVVTSCDAG